MAHSHGIIPVSGTHPAAASDPGGQNNIQACCYAYSLHALGISQAMTPPPAPDRYPMIISATALGMLTLMALLLAGAPLYTEDLWWHLKAGQMYFTEGPWPQSDWMLHTASDDAPIQHEWLFGVSVYALERLLGFQATQEFYFSSPLLYLPNLDGGQQLDTLRRRFVVLAFGQGDAEDPEESRRMGQTLRAKGIPNRVDAWGPEYPHDWPTWRDMLPRYLAEILV